MKQLVLIYFKILSSFIVLFWLSSCAPMVIEKNVVPEESSQTVTHENIDRRIGVLVGKGNTYKEIKIYYWNIQKNEWIWLTDKVLEPAWLGNAFEYRGSQAYRVQLQVIKLPQYGMYKFDVYPYYFHWFRKIYMDKYEYYLTINKDSRLIAYGGTYVGWTQEIYIDRPYGSGGLRLEINLP